jgi:lipid A 3-O-deacylase
MRLAHNVLRMDHRTTTDKMHPHARLLFGSGCIAAVLGAGLAFPAAAEETRPASFFVQGGRGEGSVGVASVGAQWPSPWRGSALGGELTAHTELFGSLWHARDVDDGRENFMQLGLVPVLRYRFAQGRSPWFVEGGIGLSFTHQRFVTRHKEFSTRLNFSDNVGFGRTFGEQGRHELSLRLQHTSNAGFKKPNPGLNLTMLRYARAF